MKYLFFTTLLILHNIKHSQSSLNQPSSIIFSLISSLPIYTQPHYPTMIPFQIYSHCQLQTMIKIPTLLLKIHCGYITETEI